MAITDAEVPQILNFGEVFDDEEVVLVSLSDAVGGLAWTRQVGELGDLIINFAYRLVLHESGSLG